MYVMHTVECGTMLYAAWSYNQARAVAKQQTEATGITSFVHKGHQNGPIVSMTYADDCGNVRIRKVQHIAAAVA